MSVLSILLLLVISCASRQHSGTTTLDFSNRKLTVIPDSVFLLTELQYLNIGNSFGFTRYPPLSALGEGKVTGDSMNQIKQIPKNISQLRGLRVFILCANDLISLPVEIAELKQLDTFDISFNKNLSVSRELNTLKRMPWLKYMNLVATNADSISVNELRKSLPQTKIVTKFEELISEASE